MARLIKKRCAAPERPSSPDGRVVRLEPSDDLSNVEHRVAHASRVEIHFPKFGDGRGYSIARLLRTRYGYKGELRAVGQFTRDHLPFMERVGFDTFELREGEEASEAVTAFSDFSTWYQK
jgi:uncharacterized protein (DUF934 family)